MNYWITTDTHFEHKAMTERFGRPVGYEEQILKGFNQITKDDIFIHLGDIAFGNEKQWCRLIGKYGYKRWLIKGNHDKRSYAWYLNNGFDFIAESITLNYMGKIVKLSHMPVKDDGYDINLHGHFHDVDLERCWSLDDLLPIKNDKQYLLMLEHHYKLFSLKNILKNNLRNEQ